MNSYQVLDAARCNRTAISTDPGCGKLAHPTAPLVLRLARDVESDHLLQARLCTNILLEFFRTNLTLVQGGNDCSNSTTRRISVWTQTPSHTVNFGHVEEDAIPNQVLRSLITHPNLYGHRADGLIILFELAGITFKKSADPQVVDRCFKLPNDYDCRDSAKRELIDAVYLCGERRASGSRGLPGSSCAARVWLGRSSSCIHDGKGETD